MAVELGTLNFFLGLYRVPLGVGAPEAPTPAGFAYGNLYLYFNGDTLPAVTESFLLTTEEHRIFTKTAGNFGKDFSVKVSFRSTAGGRQFISPVEVELLPRESRE